MSTPVIVLVVEIIIILLSIVMLLLFFQWRRKKAKAKAIEELLDNIKCLENQRMQFLIEHLHQGYGLENEKASALCELIMGAEKKFLQVFVQQQIEQTPITNFYEKLCVLLDQYLDYIPTLNSTNIYLSKEVPVSEEIETQTNLEYGKELEDSDSKEKATVKKEDEKVWENAFLEMEAEVSNEDLETEEKQESVSEENAESVIEEAEPNWGEAFSESGDEMDEATKEGFETENEIATVTETSSEENEIEPDWGEAFSESGDEMDEVTKQGFEAENKND